MNEKIFLLLLIIESLYVSHTKPGRTGRAVTVGITGAALYSLARNQEDREDICKCLEWLCDCPPSEERPSVNTPSSPLSFTHPNPQSMYQNNHPNLHME